MICVVEIGGRKPHIRPDLALRGHFLPWTRPHKLKRPGLGQSKSQVVAQSVSHPSTMKLRSSSFSSFFQKNFIQSRPPSD